MNFFMVMALPGVMLCAAMVNAASASPKSLAPIDLGHARGGTIIINGRMLPDTVYRFQLKGTVSDADTSWDLCINGRSTTLQMAPAVSKFSGAQEDLRSRVRAGMADTQARRAAERHPMAAIEILDSFAAAFRERPDLVRSSRRISDVAFEVCWQGDDDCDQYGISGTRRVVPASTIRQMLVDDARLIQLCAKQKRVITISTGGFGLPRLERMREYIEQYSGQH